MAIAAAHAGHRVAFAPATGWITRLAEAHRIDRLEAELRKISRYGLIVIDEVGYIPVETASILSDHLDGHPAASDPQAPLFPAVTLVPSKPTGKKRAPDDPTALDALAALSAEEAASRLVLDWSASIRHQTFYKSVFKPAVLRANRLAGKNVLPPNLTFHSLRHTYASLCVAAGIPPLEISRFMGHSKVTTTLTIYSHLFPSDHTEHMTALAAMNAPVAPNVVPMRRSTVG